MTGERKPAGGGVEGQGGAYLDPCAFGCGGTQRAVFEFPLPAHFDIGPKYAGKCLDCGAIGPNAATPEEAAANWNRRASSAGEPSVSATGSKHRCGGVWLKVKGFHGLLDRCNKCGEERA